MLVRHDNSSGHKGITWSVEREKWQVHIYINGKGISLGRYSKLDDAIQVHGKKYKELHREFARL